MLGLFGLLNLGSQSLQTQRQGVEITGQNLANVNNPAYARQRVKIETSVSVPTAYGPQGTGAQAVGIVQIRSAMLDRQIQSEVSIRASLESQQLALQYAQANLGQHLDRMATGAEGAAAAEGIGGSHSLSDNLSKFFNAFQSLSTNPTSLAERQTLLTTAGNLATQFNLVDGRLAKLTTSLNESVAADLSKVNSYLTEIATLNLRIDRVELASGGVANDLRDLRLSKIEELSKLVNVTVSPGTVGGMNISVDGHDLVVDSNVVETLETFDPGTGVLQLRTAGGGASVSLTGGSIHGTMEARDGTVASMRAGVNALAALLITEVNTVHAAGYSLTGSTGADLFTGTNAADISVNTAMTGNPALLQAAGVPGAVGDNQVALAIAQLANQRHAALANQTFNDAYGQVAVELGNELSSVNAHLVDQGVVERLLLAQRDSISGVSIDEEMTNLTKFQKAFEASARLVTTVDQMLDTIIGLKR